jgi:hypothetical protein
MHTVSHSISSAATGLLDAKGDTTHTTSALQVHDVSPIELSDDPAVLPQAQITTELPSIMAVATQDDSSNHAIALLRRQSTIAASPPVDQEDAVPKETKQLEQVSQTQCAKAYSSDYGLWDKALIQLQASKEDKDIVAIIVERFAKSPAADNPTSESGPSSVKGLAKDIKERLEQEINSKQHDSETHQFVERAVSVLNKFLSFGDVVVSFDPIHAALPWAAVRFFLVVSSCAACCRVHLFLKS